MSARWLCWALLVGGASSGAAHADARAPSPHGGDPAGSESAAAQVADDADGVRRTIELRALMQSLFVYMTDSDFDPTVPKYNPDGQTAGVAATLFTPRLTLRSHERFSITYEAELGLHIWSKHNPDQADPTADDALFIKHRELWAAGPLIGARDGVGDVGFKVGYQHFSDPSGLFLDHWMGVASLRVGGGEAPLWLSVGQVPDATYEGFVPAENNFEHDTFFVGAHRSTSLARGLTLRAGLFGLLDEHVVGRRMVVGAPTLSAEARIGRHALSVDAVLQLGRSDFGATGVQAAHLAGALQVHGDVRLPGMDVALNGLFLSPDDEHHHNDRDGAFLYSGKNRSATLLLTEDELRDRNNNLDERLGLKDGGFYRLRSGLVVADARVQARVGEHFRPALVAGVALVPRSANALGGRLVAAELDAQLGFVWRDAVSLDVVAAVLVPGRAGAALVNDIDRDAAQTVYMVQSSLAVRY